MEVEKSVQAVEVLAKIVEELGGPEKQVLWSSIHERVLSLAVFELVWCLIIVLIGGGYLVWLFAHMEFLTIIMRICEKGLLLNEMDTGPFKSMAYLIVHSAIAFVCAIVVLTNLGKAVDTGWSIAHPEAAAIEWVIGQTDKLVPDKVNFNTNGIKNRIKEYREEIRGEGKSLRAEMRDLRKEMRDLSKSVQKTCR